MNKTLLMTIVLAAATAAQAHFVFVVPEAGGTKARMMLGEDLNPDEGTAVDLLAGARLSVRGKNGEETPLTMSKGEHAWQIVVPGSGARLLHGVADIGMRKSGGKEHRLIYYPKAILGDPFEASVIGPESAVEIVPAGEPGNLRLKLLARGRPHADAEMTVIFPDGSQKQVRTDASGLTPAFSETGRYGAWARYWETVSVPEQRHYATVVFDVYPRASQAASMPHAASSFGAVASDGWLYVYGGHVSPTHTYWTGAVSARFDRLSLDTGKWESLPAGPALQGMNLAVHDGKMYRCGGMEPRNAKGKAPDNHSIADCARFDPAVGKWQPVPPLPQPRSSHDIAAVGDKLIVGGGWNLMGAQQQWADTVAVFDLTKPKPAWESHPQPFRRRAFIAVAYEGKMYFIGGLNEEGKIVRGVSIFDPRSNSWSEGPSLPEGFGTAFSPAAAVHSGRLYVSVSDGSILRLDAAGKSWEKVAEATPRIAHRMVSCGPSLYVIGGAAKGKNFDLVEAIAIGPPGVH